MKTCMKDYKECYTHDNRQLTKMNNIKTGDIEWARELAGHMVSNPISRRNRDWRCCCLDGSSTAQFESIREPGSPSKSILEKHACNIGKDHWYVASSWIWFGSQVSVNGFKHVRLQHDLQFTVPPGQSVYTYRGKRRCVSFSLRWIAPWSG
jgi:hypothetical protein